MITIEILSYNNTTIFFFFISFFERLWLPLAPGSVVARGLVSSEEQLSPVVQR
jgi:hypothetical protein